MTNFSGSYTIEPGTFDRADFERTRAEYDAARKAENDARMTEAVESNSSALPKGTVVIRNGEATYQSHNFVRCTAEDLRANTGSILDTATVSSGRPLAASEVGPNTVITVEGMQMTASSAERLGYLTRDGSGQYREVGKSTGPFDRSSSPVSREGQGMASPSGDMGDTPGSLERTSGDTVTEEGASEEALDPDTEARITGLAQTLPIQTQVKLVEKFADSLEFDVNAEMDVAYAKGVGLEDARSELTSIVQAGQTQADNAVMSEGIPDSDDFWTWVRSEKAPALKDAVKVHMMERSTKGYRDLAREYMANIDAFRADDVLDAVHAAGLKGRIHGGRVLMTIPGHGEMTYTSAVKLGIIPAARRA